MSELAVPIDYRSRSHERLLELLALDDEALLETLAGRRRDELRAAYAEFPQRPSPVPHGILALCRHDRRYPVGLRGLALAPLLYCRGRLDPLERLEDQPAVAIIGTRRATDYGIQTARGLASGLVASGLTVAAQLVDGIGKAALDGAVEANGAGIAVLTGALDAPLGARRQTVGHVTRCGCALSELPCGAGKPRWGALAASRTLAALSAATVVVEAGDQPHELAGAHVARSLDRAVGAVPGRVTSPFSRGSHTLLRDGAQLISDASDVLALIADLPARDRAPAERPSPGALEPVLAATLEQVRAGRDTPDKLIDRVEDAEAVLLALSRLELMGLLTRGEGGRYLPLS